ncbi:MAG: GNAT family N-acetyltransferase [Persicimonas sp.]
MAVEQITDRDELRDFLTVDKLANAYLLGNLDPAFFPFCSWWGARRRDGSLGSLLLIYQGLSLPVTFMVGSKPNFEEFLVEAKQQLPERFHFHVLENHIDTVRHVFDCSDTMRMHRMGLEKDDYQPLEATDDVERLGHRDTAAIMELYSHYPDNFFEPSQLETGLYFGIRDGDGGLSSIAGVHVVSEEYDVAVIGNLVTHPDARGRGLATRCTGQLLDALFERVSLVALNVQDDNEPAIKMYENFGFEENNVFWEGRCSAGAA